MVINHYTVTFDPTALQDLQQIYDYIGRHAGARTARTYVRRIYDHCLALQTFPERGTRRDDLRPGLRTLGLSAVPRSLFVSAGAANGL